MINKYNFYFFNHIGKSKQLVWGGAVDIYRFLCKYVIMFLYDLKLYVANKSWSVSELKHRSAVEINLCSCEVIFLLMLTFQKLDACLVFLIERIL